jgi:ATP-dependent DNA helicase RecQ
MKKIWGSLDFAALYQDYQAERSRVVAALEYLSEQGLIELETKKITDVYQVNTTGIAEEGLAQHLAEYFLANQQKEIKRIGQLLRFFELDSCLSYQLARYFDDQQAPERCGHCSVCRGKVAKLAYSQPVQAIADQQISADLRDLTQHFAAELGKLSPVMAVRFLAGMTNPWSTKYKLRQLPGFGRCAALPYADTLAQVQRLWPQ